MIPFFLKIHINSEGGTEAQGDIAPITLFATLLVVLQHYNCEALTCQLPVPSPSRILFDFLHSVFASLKSKSGNERH